MPKSGILLVDKPGGMTSHDLVNIARKTFHTKKIGHNGTLDPDAPGVMVLCVGQATRLNEYLTADDKRYRAVLSFGQETDTQDASGQVTRTCALPDMDEAAFTQILTRFIGVQEQQPPMYSAIKKNGKPLYQYAREGKDVADVPTRQIEIYDLQCLVYDGKTATMDIHCSKGTYIRTLCQDIARACGSCGHMSALRRTAAGTFRLEHCLSVEALRASDDPYALLLPMADALDLAKITLTQVSDKMALWNGKRIRLNGEKPPVSASEWVQAVYEGELLAIGQIKGNDFVPKKVFHDGGEAQ